MVKIIQVFTRAKRFVRLSLILITCFWLGSCTQSQANFDFLEGKPCAAPCWQGITPGTTDENTTLKIISNPDLVQQDSIKSGISPSDPSISSYRYQRISGGSGSIALKDGIVYRIDILPSDHLTLEDVINAFGNPDFVHVQDSSQEQYCYATDLYYLEKGIWINAGVCDARNTEYKVQEHTAWVYSDIEVGGVTFFEPKSNLESVLATSLQFTPNSVKDIVANAYPWKGFDFYPLTP